MTLFWSTVEGGVRGGLQRSGNWRGLIQCEARRSLSPGTAGGALAGVPAASASRRRAGRQRDRSSLSAARTPPKSSPTSKPRIGDVGDVADLAMWVA